MNFCMLSLLLYWTDGRCQIDFLSGIELYYRNRALKRNYVLLISGIKFFGQNIDLISLNWFPKDPCTTWSYVVWCGHEYDCIPSTHTVLRGLCANGDICFAGSRVVTLGTWLLSTQPIRKSLSVLINWNTCRRSSTSRSRAPISTFLASKQS
jgi:hypothetical protein